MFHFDDIRNNLPLLNDKICNYIIVEYSYHLGNTFKVNSTLKSTKIQFGLY